MTNAEIRSHELEKFIQSKIEEFAINLHETIYNKLLNLPSHCKIFPAHHWVGVQSTENGIFHTTPEMARKLSLLDLSKKDFVKEVTLRVPRPMNYEMIIKVNKGTTPLLEDQVSDLEMDPNRCSIQIQ